MTINDWVGLFLGRLSKGDCFIAGGCLFTVKNVTAKKIRVESVRGGFDVLVGVDGFYPPYSKAARSRYMYFIGALEGDLMIDFSNQNNVFHSFSDCYRVCLVGINGCKNG